MLSDLLIELKIAIASLNERAWINLYIADPIFAQYAQTYAAKHLFITLFTKRETYTEDSFVVTTTKLFGKLHSIYDAPAKIYTQSNTLVEMWYYQDLCHRYNDQPTSQCANKTNSLYIWHSHGKRIPRANGDANRIERFNGALIESWYNGNKRIQQKRDGVVIN